MLTLNRIGLLLVPALLVSCFGQRSKDGEDGSTLAEVSLTNVPGAGWEVARLRVVGAGYDRSFDLPVSDPRLSEQLTPGAYVFELSLLAADQSPIYSSLNCSTALRESQNHVLVAGPNTVSIFVCRESGDVVNPPSLASARIAPVLIGDEGRVQGLLNEKCGACHGDDGDIEPSFLDSLRAQTRNVASCLSLYQDAEEGIGRCIATNAASSGIYRSRLVDQQFVAPAGGRDLSGAVMPPRVTNPVFTAEEFEIVKNWLVYEPRTNPTLTWINTSTTTSTNTSVIVEEPCENDIKDSLRQHIVDSQTSGWRPYHQDSGTPMYACPEADDFPRDPSACFAEAQYASDASFLSPAADREDLALRLVKLRDLDFITSYWQRISPDGRFVANGNYRIDDLAVADRTINVVFADFDPGFSPDNRRFMYVDMVCSSDLLRDLSITSISTEQCRSISDVETYQSIGGTPWREDFVVIHPGMTYEADNIGSMNTFYRDHSDFGDDTTSIFRVAPNAQGDLVSVRSQVRTTNETQSQISPSSKLIIGRYSNRLGNGRYHIHFLDDYVPGYRTDNQDKSSRFCMPGTKALTSYDDRFLVTHSMGQGQNYSDIWLGDLYTGKRYKLTGMPPGAFAVYPHFRADNWIYFQVRDHRNGVRKDSIWATDAAILIERSAPVR